jgi:hypothetical protein
MEEIGKYKDNQGDEHKVLYDTDGNYWRISPCPQIRNNQIICITEVRYGPFQTRDQAFGLEYQVKS